MREKKKKEKRKRRRKKEKEGKVKFYGCDDENRCRKVPLDR